MAKLLRQTAFLIFCFGFLVFASPAQDKTTGGVRGKVRMPNGNSIADVTVRAKQEGKEISSAKTDRKGEFAITGLKPGVYDFVFTKEGLTEGVLPRIEVAAGESTKLTRLVLAIDQGSLAIIRGSVFDPHGRSVRGAKVAISKLSGDSTKKISESISSESGEFSFKLPPGAATYRVVVRIEGAETATKDVSVDGAQIYRVAVSLKPAN